MKAGAGRFVYPAFFAIAAVAPLRPLRDFDYFWHLAAGRWIHEHGALPRHDPFGVATDPTPWINGEWLFQFLLYPLHAVAGPNGIVVARALLIGTLFTALLAWTARETRDLSLSLALCTVAWFGAIWAFSERPATFAAAFVVIAVLLTLQEPTRRRIVIYTLLTIVWMNFHPSALLAPVIAAAGAPNRRRIAMIAASAMALLVNPYGIEGVLAPQRLVRWVMTGPFMNIEWQAALPATHPFLYSMIALTLVAFAFDRQRRHVPHLFLLVLFGTLAIRFLRNHAMFYSVWPILTAPLLPPLSSPWLRKLVAGAASAFLIIFLATRRPAAGIDEHWLPVRATAQLVALQPPGNIFAAGHFGGYLISAFYPQRRVVNDGRNELHHRFLTEYAAARRSSAGWRRLVEKYRIMTAVADYEPPLPLKDARSGRVVAVPASRAFYPRSQWALVAFDDAAMVFVRRDAWAGRDLRAVEYRLLVPDDPSPHLATPELRAEALRELARARRILGEDSETVSRIAAAIAAGH